MSVMARNALYGRKMVRCGSGSSRRVIIVKRKQQVALLLAATGVLYSLNASAGGLSLIYESIPAHCALSLGA